MHYKFLHSTYSNWKFPKEATLSTQLCLILLLSLFRFLWFPISGSGDISVSLGRKTIQTFENVLTLLRLGQFSVTFRKMCTLHCKEESVSIRVCCFYFEYVFAKTSTKSCNNYITLYGNDSRKLDFFMLFSKKFFNAYEHMNLIV